MGNTLQNCAERRKIWGCLSLSLNLTNEHFRPVTKTPLLRLHGLCTAHTTLGGRDQKLKPHDSPRSTWVVHCSTFHRGTPYGGSLSLAYLLPEAHNLAHNKLSAPHPPHPVLKVPSELWLVSFVVTTSQMFFIYPSLEWFPSIFS